MTIVQVKIGDICTLGDGAHAKVKRTEQGFPYLTSKNIKNGDLDLKTVDYISEEDYIKLFSTSKNSVRDLQSGDILIGIIGTFGNCYMYKATDKFGISSSVAILRPNIELIIPDFLYYFVSSEQFNDFINSIKGGSVQGYTNLNTIRNISIPLPQKSIQNQIVTILTSLDDKIKLNRRMNETLEHMAMALYKHWFVDFGPFQDGDFEESELGMIPKGWSVGRIGNLIKIKHGYAFKGEFFSDEGDYILLTPGNFQEKGGLKLKGDKEKYYVGEFPEEYLLKKGDLLVVMTDLSQSSPFLGSPAFITKDNLFLHNQRLGKVIINGEHQAQVVFLYHLLNSFTVREHIRQSASGTTVKHTSPDRIYSVPCVIPSLELQEKFANHVDDWINQIQKNEQENQHLMNIRSYLLPRLLSGDIEVQTAEEQIQEVLTHG